MKKPMMSIAYKKVNGYTISDNTNHQHLLYGRGVSAPIILVYTWVSYFAIFEGTSPVIIFLW